MASTVYTSISAAGAALRNAMAQYKTSFTVCVRVSSSLAWSHKDLWFPNGSLAGTHVLAPLMVDVRDALLYEAVRHTGAGNAGDFFSMNIVGIGRSCDLSDFDTNYIEVDCTYTTYSAKHTTAQGLIAWNTWSPIMSNTSKARGETDEAYAARVYEIVRTLGATYVDPADTEIIDLSLYGLLVNNKASSGPFACALYSLLNKGSVEARVVTGTLHAAGGDIKNHCWVLAKIGSLWYHFDVSQDVKNGTQNNYFKKTYTALNDRTLNGPYLRSEWIADHPGTTS